MKPTVHPMLTALSVPSDVAACHTAFFVRAGMQAKYANVEQCFKTLSGPTAGEHTKFLAARREWVGPHNSDPIRARLCSRAALREVQAMLEVEKKRGVRFQRKGTFVLLENWNAETMGPVDPARVVDEFF